MTPRNALIRWLAIAVFIAVFDQITKQVILGRVAEGEAIPVTSFFSIVLAFNTGAAFSFLADAGGWQRTFFIAIAVIAVIVIVWLLRKHRDESPFSLGLSLILGGAIGNLWDRVWLGKVVDFLLFYYHDWHWPAFNVADSAISVGAAILILDSFYGSKRRSEPA
ncbi:MAG: signal peptidase II [Burkholderiales bacterium]